MSSCTRDLDISEPEYSDVGFLTSAFRNQQLNVGVDNFMTFTGLSINEVEHRWTITENSAFLKGPLQRNDTILEDFVIPNAGLVSTDKIVNVLFREGGLHTVNFYNSFRDSVSYRTSQGNIPSVKVGDLYVIDTTFTVDVYDTIVPVIDIRQQGVSVAFRDSTDVITIEAGDVLEFVDLSVKDRVTTRAWRIEENGTVNDSVGIFQFNKLGEFKGVADLTRSGDNIPFDFERYEIPATFRVIPSSKPFVVAGDIIELENEVIQIPFNGEFAPFGSQEEFFTVTLNDPVNGNRELAISSVERNSQDATLLEITLSEPIYRPDVITVSYAGGALMSTDTRIPVEFTDLPVLMHDVSIVPEELLGVYDFEGAAADLAWGPRGDNEGGSFEISDERASSGVNSLKITGSGGTIRFSCSEAVDIPDGVYVMTFDIFIEDGGGPFNAVWPTIGNPFFQQWRDCRPAAVPRGEWFTITTTNDINGGITAADIAARIEGGGVGTIYVDNWKILTKESRP